MFINEYPLSKLRGAEYNPRLIDEPTAAALRQSIVSIGVVKPVIATSQGLIVAGHQRTKAMRALGIETAPVFVVESVGDHDEIRFNQLHNGTDMDRGDERVRVPPADGVTGFVDVGWNKMTGNLRATGAMVRATINGLMIKYGLWGAAVATHDGEVINGAQYALACMAARKPCRIYYLPEGKKAEAIGFLNKTYGVFSYDHIPRNTYAQSYAQMMRLRNGASGKLNRSQLYEHHVLHHLKPHERLLDLGCGQADYVKMLKKKGYNVWGMEFFSRKGNAIDTRGVQAMCDALFKTLREEGRFDVVVLDAVLNSTDSLQAEIDVLTVLNALCKPGGRVYLSGRLQERLEKLERLTYNAHSKKRYVEFLDGDGYTAIFNRGVWTFQRFHTPQQLETLVSTYYGGKFGYNNRSDCFQIETTKSIDLPDDQVEASLRREFNLPHPNGKSVGRGDDAVSAWRDSLKLG